MWPFIGVISTLAIILGLVNLVKPLKFMRIQNRRQALLLLGAGIIAFSISVANTPTTAPTVESTTSQSQNSSTLKQTQPKSSSDNIKIEFSGQFDPPILAVGEKLVIKLGIKNHSQTTLHGIRIFGDGPWKKYTVVNVMPGGNFEQGLLGANITSGMEIPPGETRFVNIIAYPNEPGNHNFSFIPHALTGQKLVNEVGEDIVIGGKIAVISR